MHEHNGYKGNIPPNCKLETWRRLPGGNMQFTDAQQRAIDHVGGNLQLIACAGSGKTEVVARRVVTLLTS